MTNALSLNTINAKAQDPNSPKGLTAKKRPRKTVEVGPIPPPLIGGDKNTVLPMKKVKRCPLHVSVDWVTFTIPFLDQETPDLVAWSLLSCMTGDPEAHLMDAKRGLTGCSKTVQLSKVDECGEVVQAALIGFMPKTDKSMGLLVVSISGSSCHLFDMTKLEAFPLKHPGSKLTRVDLALDDFLGEFSVRKAQYLYKSGSFQAKGKAHGGKMPVSTFIEAKNGETSLGKTFYVGKRANGKMLRVYEKGIKECDDRSSWVRWEVQFGNKDRILPWSMLGSPSSYFIGSYAPFDSLFGQRVVNATPTYIKTEQNTKAQTSLKLLLSNCRVQYGKAINIALAKVNIRSQSPSLILNLIRRSGVPGRLIMPDAWALDKLFGEAPSLPF